MVLDYLKVKIKSLAAEAKIIRDMENKRLLKANRGRQILNLEKTIAKHERAIERLTKQFNSLDDDKKVLSEGITLINRTQLHRSVLELLHRKKNKPRVDQSKIDYHDMVYHGLHNHRVYDVRKESRAALLAYGFIKGYSYSDLEKGAQEEPD